MARLRICVERELKEMHREAEARGMSFDRYVVELHANAKADIRRAERLASEHRTSVTTKDNGAEYPDLSGIQEAARNRSSSSDPSRSWTAGRRGVSKYLLETME